MRFLTLILTIASLSAEPVYLSSHGKTFHKQAACSRLARAQHVYTAERSQAEAHQLHECALCYRKGDGAAKAAGAASWATETKRAETKAVAQ